MNIFTSKWLCNIKRILDETGNSNIWLYQNEVAVNVNRTWLCKNIERTLIDQYIAKWSHEVDISPKSFYYRGFKCEFGYEKYLNMSNTKNRITLTRFRTSNHRLPIETGRWSNTPRNERLCIICDEGCVCDEYHFILECSGLSAVRQLYLPRYYCKRPFVAKFITLFSTCNEKLLNKLCVYIRESNKIL